MSSRPSRRTPPADLLVRGQYAESALLVRYVDEDASGELRLVEQLPDRPGSRSRPRTPCAA